MSNPWKIATVSLAILAVILGACLALLWHHLHGSWSISDKAVAADAGALVHVSNQFDFVLHAPLATVAPLFGAEREKVWGGDNWHPEFLYPTSSQEVKDVKAPSSA